MNSPAVPAANSGIDRALQGSAVCGELAHCADFRPGGIELAPWLKYLLFKWCYCRFQLQIPTHELMAAARSLQERRVVAIIAMKDVDALSLRNGLNSGERALVEACHRYLAQIDWCHP